MRMLAAMAGLVMVATVGCSSGEGSSSDVDWSKYPGNPQSVIDGYAADKSCDALQEMFNNFEKANQTTDGGTSDIMGYIDEKMREAGCYE